jgi:hypothetical protein
MLADATAKRDVLLKDTGRIRAEVIESKNSNTLLIAQNKQLEHELERLETYAEQLNSNINDVMVDYRT